MPTDSSKRPRVVVLGGGFAGLGAAQKLKGSDAEVVLVDRHDYHTFQPLLYQVATGLLDTATVGHAMRDLFHKQPNARVHQASVTGIDLASREVRFDAIEPLTYDYLVIALGAQVNFFGVEGAQENAFPLYTLPDAMRLRNHVLGRWEAADRDPSLVDDGALNVVVVGGGPTGIESVGALAELYSSNLSEDYPDVRMEQARLTLVEAGPTLFPMFRRDIQEYTTRILEKRGIDVRVGETVASISPTRVSLKSGEQLPAHTLVWGAGLQGNAIVRSLGIDLQRGYRIGVAPDLTVPGHPEVYAVGDIAAITDAKDGDVLPQLGSVAQQSGQQAGHNIARRLRDEGADDFTYHDKGTMAAIGRGAAVVQMRRGRTMKGKAAALAWGAVHAGLLPAGQDRARAALRWTIAGFTHERAGRIIVDEDEHAEPVEEQR
jgi:NADH:ubiquinone reductase (H+-translocating)